MEELKKDLSTKELLRNPDVFADISNVHLFGGEEVIRPEDLEPLPQDMVYRKRKGKLETLMGDVRMRFKKEGIVIAMIQAENQAGICNTMPVRDLGYIYANYKEQIKEQKKKNAAEGKRYFTREIGDEDRLEPVITFVLYYGKEEWKRPLSLLDMLDLEGEEKKKLEPFLLNHQLHLISLTNQDKETTEKYKSDFWHVATYLSARNDRKKREQLARETQRHIRHPEELMDVLYAFSEDERYLEMKEEAKGKEDTTMCEMLDEVERRGMEKGLERGLEQGLERGLEQGLEQGMERGKEQVNRLTACLIQDGRTEELFQATQDSELQEKLMEEYGI